MQALGVDIQTIQSIVGHADTEMTEHDLHVQESIRQSANYREPAFQIVGINAGSHIAADDVASKKPTCPCD